MHATLAGMRRALPIVLAIFPLAVIAASFKWFPNSNLLGPVIIGSVLAGWTGLGFASIRRPWVRVLMLMIYPLAMAAAGTVLMIAIYGVPGLD